MHICIYSTGMTGSNVHAKTVHSFIEFYLIFFPTGSHFNVYKRVSTACSLQGAGLSESQCSTEMCQL